MINYECRKEFQPNYKTPKIEKKIDIEMHKTQKTIYKNKPFLNCSMLPSAFELTRISQKVVKKILPSIPAIEKINLINLNVEKSHILTESNKIQKGKIILKPIEIKDPRKNYFSEKSPEIKLSLEMEETFARTSNANFPEGKNRKNFNSLNRGTEKKAKESISNLSVIVEKSEKMRLEDMIILSSKDEFNMCKVLYLPKMKLFSLKVMWD